MHQWHKRHCSVSQSLPMSGHGFSIASQKGTPVRPQYSRLHEDHRCLRCGHYRSTMRHASATKVKCRGPLTQLHHLAVKAMRESSEQRQETCERSIALSLQQSARAPIVEIRTLGMWTRRAVVPMGDFDPLRLGASSQKPILRTRSCHSTRPMRRASRTGTCVAHSKAFTGRDRARPHGTFSQRRTHRPKCCRRSQTKSANF